MFTTICWYSFVFGTLAQIPVLDRGKSGSKLQVRIFLFLTANLGNTNYLYSTGINLFIHLFITMFCYLNAFITLAQMGLVKPQSTCHQYNSSSLVLDLLLNSSGYSIDHWKTLLCKIIEENWSLRCHHLLVYGHLCYYVSCQENMHPLLKILFYKYPK